MLTLDEIVTEYGVLGETVPHGSMERTHIVNSFAGEAGLPMQILIHVGNRRGVGIEARLSAEDLGDPRAQRGFHAHRNAWTHERIAFRHNLCGAVNRRPIEWMRHYSDHLGRGVARQLRVGIQCDHVADRVQPRHVAGDGLKPVALAEQQLVQIVQLAALALITHPLSLARIPSPRPMEKVKGARLAVSVALVQMMNTFQALSKDRIIFGFRLVGIRKVGE